MREITIRATVDKINVDPRYFDFYYEIHCSDRLIEKDTYSSSHSWLGKEDEFKCLLESGYALRLALEHGKYWNLFDNKQ